MLKHRVLSATLIISGLLAVYFFAPTWGVWATILGIFLLGIREYFNFLKVAGLTCFPVVGILSGVVVMAGTWAEYRCHTTGGFTIGITIGVLMILLRQLWVKDEEKPFQTIGSTLFGLIYVGFLVNFLNVLILAWSEGDVDGRFLAVYMIIVTKITDIGAYFTGCAIGRHKMIPRISPNKTWEGCTGGVVSAIVASLACYTMTGGDLGVVQFTAVDAVALGILLSISGILGDLIESVLKRRAGVKDSGTWIAGMGGVLDVMDSLLFAAPIMYIYTCLFLL